eukprot:1317474-Amorphochlora_amoeboformis.AAC.1
MSTVAKGISRSSTIRALETHQHVLALGPLTPPLSGYNAGRDRLQPVRVRVRVRVRIRLFSMS